MKAIAFIIAAAISTSGVAFAKKEVKAVQPAAVTMKVNTETSTVEWTGKKVVINSAHHGTLKLKSGEVVVSKNQLLSGKFVVDMNSLTNLDQKDDAKSKAKLEGHLKSPDFFNVAAFPEATFKMTSAKPIAATATAPANYEITGEMTIKSVTKPLTFPAVVKIEGDKADATATVTIDRTVWDIKYGSGKFFQGLGDKVIADEMVLDLKLSAAK